MRRELFQCSPWGEPVTDYHVLLVGGPHDGELITVTELAPLINVPGIGCYLRGDTYDGVTLYSYANADWNTTLPGEC